MSDRVFLRGYYQVIALTTMLLVVLLLFKGMTQNSVAVLIYISLCCALCICIAHLRNIGVLNYKEKWLYLWILGIPLFYFFFILVFRAFFYEAYATYISLFTFAEEAVSSILPSMDKTERDLLRLGLQDRVVEARHNFVFAGFWNILGSYLICSHSISLSNAEKNNLLKNGYPETFIDKRMKISMIIFVITFMFGFNFSWVTSESCSIRCGGVESSESIFFVLYNLGPFLSWVTCTFIFKINIISEYSKSIKKQQGENSNE